MNRFFLFFIFCTFLYGVKCVFWSVNRIQGLFLQDLAKSWWLVVVYYYYFFCLFYVRIKVLSTKRCANAQVKKKKKAVAAHHVINTALSQGSRIATGYIWEWRNLRPPKVFKNTVLRKKKKISMQILFFFFFFFSFSIAMSMIWPACMVLVGHIHNYFISLLYLFIDSHQL